MIDHQLLYNNVKDSLRRITTESWTGPGQEINLDSDPRFMASYSIPPTFLTLLAYNTFTLAKVYDTAHSLDKRQPAILINEIQEARYGYFKSRNIVNTDLNSKNEFNNIYQTRYIAGKSFLCFPYLKAYWHLVIEDIAFYLQLKEIWPDMQFVLCKTKNVEDLFQSKTWIKDNYYILKEKFPESFIEVDIDSLNSIVCEKSYSMNVFDVDQPLKTYLNAFQLLSNLYNSLYGNLSQGTDKIFLYSKAKNKQLLDYLKSFEKEINEYIEKGIIDSNGNVLVKYPNYDSHEAKTAYQFADIFARALSPENEQKILSYFESKGFKIVDLGEGAGIGLKDQIEMFQKCSQVAIFAGASTLAACMVNKHCKVFIINSHPKYDFPHARYAKSIKFLCNSCIKNNRRYYDCIEHKDIFLEEIFDTEAYANHKEDSECFCGKCDNDKIYSIDLLINEIESRNIL